MSLHFWFHLGFYFLCVSCFWSKTQFPIWYSGLILSRPFWPTAFFFIKQPLEISLASVHLFLCSSSAQNVGICGGFSCQIWKHISSLLKAVGAKLCVYWEQAGFSFLLLALNTCKSVNPRSVLPPPLPNWKWSTGPWGLIPTQSLWLAAFNLQTCGSV